MNAFMREVTVIGTLLLTSFPSKSFASDLQDNRSVRKVFLKVTDSSLFSVCELGLKITDEPGTVMIGSPHSRKYNFWLENVKYFSPNYEIINQLFRIVHKTTVKEDGITISRNCRFISHLSDTCRAFIDKELDNLLHLLGELKIEQNSNLFITGEIHLYGIDDEAERENLRVYRRVQEIKKLGALGCTVKFV